MADLRVTGAPSPTALQPARPSEAVRAAQRAFFNTALNAAAGTQSAPPVQAKTQTASPRAQAASPTSEGEALQYARPGSRLDIRV